MTALDIKTPIRLEKNLLSAIKGTGDLGMLVEADVLIFLPAETRKVKLRELVEAQRNLKQAS